MLQLSPLITGYPSVQLASLLSLLTSHHLELLSERQIAKCTDSGARQPEFKLHLSHFLAICPQTCEHSDLTSLGNMASTMK